MLPVTILTKSQRKHFSMLSFNLDPEFGKQQSKTAKKTRKTKKEIKRVTTDSLINAKLNENNNIEERASKVVKSEDEATIFK